jgi:WD40 repeat protein
MPEVFISYARGDARAFVGELAAELERRGVDVWVDLDDIPPGSQWRRELTDALTASDALAYVISPAAVASPFCANELEQALEQNKRLVPIRLELPADPSAVPAAIEAANWIPSDVAFDPANTAHLDALVDAIRTDREWVRDHTRLSVQASEWEARDRDRALLLRGSELAAAEDWLDRAADKDPQPTESQRLFVSASRRAGRRRTRTLIAGMAIALVVTAGLAVVALQQRAKAQQRADEARAGLLAAQADAVSANDPELSVILALAATRQDPSSAAAEQELRAAISSSFVRHRLEVSHPIRLDVDPKSGLVAIASFDGIYLWDPSHADVDTRQLVPGQRFTEVSFDAKGERLAVAKPTGRVWIYKVSDGSVLKSWKASDSAIYSLDFSRDGRLLSAGTDGRVRVWNPDRPRRLLTIRDPGTVIYDAAWSHDGTRIATGDDIGDATVWNSRSGERVAVNRLPFRDEILSVAFSTSGREVLSAAAQSSSRLWNAQTGTRVESYPALSSAATAATFGVDGRVVLISTNDGRTLAYERDDHRLLFQLRGHSAAISSAAILPFSGDFVTSSIDGTVREWELLEHGTSGFPSESLGSVAISHDGKTGYYGYRHHLVARDIRDPKSDRLIANADNDIYRVGISPDNSELVIAGASREGSVRRNEVEAVDAASGQQIGRGVNVEGPRLDNVAFMPDGKNLFLQSKAGAGVFDPGTHEFTTRVSSEGVTSWLDGEPSPDGTTFAVGGEDGVVRFYPVTDDGQAGRINAHTIVNGIDFSPDGSQIAVATNDGLVRLYDVRSHRLLSTVADHGGPAYDVTFSPDGHLLASSGFDQRIRIADADTSRLVADLPDVGLVSTRIEFAPDGRILTYGQLTLLRACAICDLDLSGLQALAERRITREPTAQERDRYGLD